MSMLVKKILRNSTSSACVLISVRNAARKTFIPFQQQKVTPELFYSLEERLREKDEKLQDPELYKKVNIGLPLRVVPKASRAQLKSIKNAKNNVELEKQARNCTLVIDLEQVEKDWCSSNKSKHVKILAENYKIFDHLFGEFAFFNPVVNMNISYDYDESLISPVYTGNLLKPAETAKAPTIQFDSEPNELWTLILTNPDGNLYDNEAEMVHWFVGNIPGGCVEKGEEIIDYLSAIPPKGSGFHRYVFVLYKQNERIDFSKYRKEKPCLNLKERTFKTLNFYEQFQDQLTPAGLSWFQADWDSSLKKVFHDTLKMSEPFYEYEFPKPYLRPPQHFPHHEAFNRYMDLHRDPLETQKLMLLKRLANVHPFHGEKPRLPFPHCVPLDRTLPVWLKNETRYERDGIAKYRDIYRGDDRPYQYVGKRTPFVAFRPSSRRNEQKQ